MYSTVHTYVRMYILKEDKVVATAPTAQAVVWHTVVQRSMLIPPKDWKQVETPMKSQYYTVYYMTSACSHIIFLNTSICPSTQENQVPQVTTSDRSQCTHVNKLAIQSLNHTNYHCWYSPTEVEGFPTSVHVNMLLYSISSYYKLASQAHGMSTAGNRL